MQERHIECKTIDNHVLLERLVADGIAEVEATEEGLVREGCLDGFELASQTYPSYPHFEWAVRTRQAELKKLEAAAGDEDTETYERWLKFKSATDQLTWCRDVMLMAHASKGGQVPLNTRISGQAAIKFIKILDSNL